MTDEPQAGTPSESTGATSTYAGSAYEHPRSPFAVPRPAGSGAERAAARELVNQFHAHAVPSIELSVSVPTIEGYRELTIIPLFLLAILIGLFSPILGTLAIAVALAIYLAEDAGIGVLAHVVPHRASSIVLAAIPAQRNELRKLIVTAPIDSQQSGRILPRLQDWVSLHAPRLIGLVAVIAFALCGWRAFGERPLLDWLLLLPAASYATLLVLIGDRAWASTSPVTATADSKDLEALVQLAGKIRNHPLRWVDVWCLGLGGGTISGEALRQFIRDNELPLDTTYLLNLLPGRGDVDFALTEGALWTQKSAPSLLRMVAGATDRRPRPRLGQTTALAVALRQGYQAVTLRHDVGAGDGTTLPNLLYGVLNEVDQELVERDRVARLARATERRRARAAPPARR